MLEIESEGVPPHVVTVAPADGRPAFVANASLCFAHRGACASKEVLRELEGLAQTLTELPRSERT